MSKPTFPVDLHHFTCTEGYHRFGIRRNVVCTDGVKYLAESAQAFWMLDIIASYQGTKEVRKCDGMQFWTLEKKGEKGAVVYCQRDDGEPKCVEQEVEYTDFPFISANQKVKIWVVAGDMVVLMLPSEY